METCHHPDPLGATRVHANPTPPPPPCPAPPRRERGLCPGGLQVGSRSRRLRGPPQHLPLAFKMATEMIELNGDDEGRAPTAEYQPTAQSQDQPTAQSQSKPYRNRRQTWEWKSGNREFTKWHDHRTREWEHDHRHVATTCGYEWAHHAGHLEYQYQYASLQLQHQQYLSEQLQKENDALKQQLARTAAATHVAEGTGQESRDKDESYSDESYSEESRDKDHAVAKTATGSHAG